MAKTDYTRYSLKDPKRAAARSLHFREKLEQNLRREDEDGTRARVNGGVRGPRESMYKSRKPQ
jgi:hypothetical protein